MSDNKATQLTAVVLAGGQGTRLQPYTAVLPKPLVPIGDRPIIEILLGHLQKHGVRRVVLAVNHLAHLITALIGDGSRLGLEVEYSLEQQALSTVGPLRLISDLPDSFLVANGDILTDLDIGALVEQHLSTEAMVTIACTGRDETVDFGVLRTDSKGWLAGFEEKPTNRFEVSMGVYVFSRQVLELIPSDKPFGFDQLMAALLDRGLPVGTFRHEGYWLDIGRIADFEKAQGEIETIRRLGL